MDWKRRQRIYDDEQVREEAKRDYRQTHTGDGSGSIIGLILIVIAVFYYLIKEHHIIMQWVFGTAVAIVVFVLFIRRAVRISAIEHEQRVRDLREKEAAAKKKIEIEGKEKEEAERLKLQEEQRNRPGKILVVDDQVGIRLLLIEILSSVGYEVLQAGNGRTALEIMKNFRIELVLLDLKIPGMDGLAILEKIREMGSDAKVIMMTAYEESWLAFKNELEQLDVLRVFIKPFDTDELKQYIFDAVTPPAREMVETIK